jgi:hypothetical protein
MPLRIGFWSGGSAPLFSSLSKSTNNLSISRSFSSSDISGKGPFFCSTIPVMGLIGAPVGVVSDAFEGPVSLGGAENNPLLKSKPATLPYPTKAQSVVAAKKKCYISRNE